MTDMKKRLSKPDHSAVNEVYVSIRILGEEVDPKLISSRLALVPTKAYAKGQEYDSKGGSKLKHPTGNWTLTSEKLTDSRNVEDHAIALLERMAGKESVIQAFKSEGCCVSITVWWRPKDGHGTFSLSSNTLVKLSSYGDEVMVYVS
jgi:hypothetical protein